MAFSSFIRGAATIAGVLIAAQSMAAAPDELVCREQLRPGSRIVMRTCATKVEWITIAERDAALRQSGATVSAFFGGSPAASMQGAAQNWGGFQRGQ
jgi:hypothetical protein